MTYEKSFFVKYLGDSPYIRVLDYFIANDTYDCSLQDAAEGTQLSRNTIRKVLNEMLELKIIKPTRNVGKAKMFQINKANEYAKHLIKLDRNLSKLYSNTLQSTVLTVRKEH